MEQKKLYCHFCGIERENPQQSKCSRCGALFVETCSRCGEPVKKGRDNCVKCGLSIDKMFVPPPGMRVVSESEIIRRKLPRDERVQKKKIPVWARNLITAVLIVTAIFIVNIVYENFSGSRLNSDVKSAKYVSALEKADTYNEKVDVVAMNGVSLAANELITEIYPGEIVVVKNAWLVWSSDGCRALLEIDVSNSDDRYAIYLLVGQRSPTVCTPELKEIPLPDSDDDEYWQAQYHNIAVSAVSYEYIVEAYKLSDKQIKIINDQIKSGVLKDADFIYENHYSYLLPDNLKKYGR